MVAPIQLIEILRKVGYEVVDLSMGNRYMPDFVLLCADGLPDVSFHPSNEIVLEDARAILLSTRINIPQELLDKLRES